MTLPLPLREGVCLALDGVDFDGSDVLDGVGFVVLDGVGLVVFEGFALDVFDGVDACSDILGLEWEGIINIYR